ncbi:MAG: PIN domain-containing protein [Bacteroidota bacterium]
MIDQVLLDTNVLVYAKDEESDFYRRAASFVERSEANLVITSKSISEYLVVVTRGDEPLSSIEDALQDIQDFTQNFTLIYPTQQSYQKLNTLLQQYEIRGKRIHDLEMVAIGLANDIVNVATFNTKDFATIDEIRVIEP